MIRLKDKNIIGISCEVEVANIHCALQKLGKHRASKGVGNAGSCVVSVTERET
jgi:hypothetical protein